MEKFKSALKTKKAQAAVFASGMLASLYANATILEDTQTALTAAKADAVTVGGYVIAAIAALVGITMIIQMVRKA